MAGLQKSPWAWESHQLWRAARALGYRVWNGEPYVSEVIRSPNPAWLLSFTLDRGLDRVAHVVLDPSSLSWHGVAQHGHTMRPDLRDVRYNSLAEALLGELR